MAGRKSIKLFQFHQKVCQTIGIYTTGLNEKRYQLISIRLICVISLIQLAMATAAFLSYDAKSMGEFGIGFYALITTIHGMIAYMIVISKMDDVLKYVKNCEEFIEKSKWEYW